MVWRRQVYSLTDDGIKQAELASREVEKLDYDFIICSPLKRTKDTCRIINVKNKDVIEDDRIMERDCGEMKASQKKVLIIHITGITILNLI